MATQPGKRRKQTYSNVKNNEVTASKVRKTFIINLNNF